MLLVCLLSILQLICEIPGLAVSSSDPGESGEHVLVCAEKSSAVGYAFTAALQSWTLKALRKHSKQKAAESEHVAQSVKVALARKTWQWQAFSGQVIKTHTLISCWRAREPCTSRWAQQTPNEYRRILPQAALSWQQSLRSSSAVFCIYNVSSCL